MSKTLSHFDARGNAHMVDVGAKDVTERVAVAGASVIMQPATLTLIKDKKALVVDVRDLPELQAKGLAHYHAWAFATVRQLGAAAELMVRYLTWLGEQPAEAIAAYDLISQGAKTFILKAARAVNSKKPFDPAATFDEWARAWDTAMRVLAQ